MADKKPTKKTEVKKVTKESVKDLRDMDIKSLTAKIAESQKDLIDAKRSLAAGELVNPRVIAKYRKEIARLKTILVEKAREATRKEDV